MRKIVFAIACLALTVLGTGNIQAQDYMDEAPNTYRPLLQKLGKKLLKDKQGSIVAVDPATGEVLCLVTNSPDGSNDALAIGTAYPPGSTINQPRH